MSDGHADIASHVRSYIRVFIALAVLTVLTVFASRQDFGSMNVAIALAIAAIKATLVAMVFMHLKSERSISIWWSLGICAVLFVVLMVLPTLAVQDHPPMVRMGTWG